MNVHKILGGAGAIAGAVAAARSADTSKAVNDSHTKSVHFNGALFQQGRLAGQFKRGPIARMPLKGAKSNAKGAKGKGSKSRHISSSEEGEIESASHEVSSDDLEISQVPVLFGTDGDGENDHSDDRGDGEKKRFERFIQMPALTAVDQGSEKSTSSSKATQAVALKPLPPMNSLKEVVKFIQSSVQSNPTNNSMAQTLRQINAAVLRNEISLPKITKVSDARNILIEIFGKGHGPDSAQASLRGIYAMLPLWLVNLSKRRTVGGQKQAAARLSLTGALISRT
jgi:hypothetical protein